MAKAHRLPIIEDACQAIGAEQSGRRAGSLGWAGCFSFYPTKNLGGVGDGGMVVTKSAELGELCSVIRSHGGKPKYYHKLVGANFRLDAIQAAILRVKLKHLPEWTKGRQRNAARYNELLADAPITRPTVRDGNESIYNQYVIRHSSRDGLRSHLQEHGIGTEIYYPLPLHLQECFSDLGCKPGSLPVAEEAAKQVLALPVYPELNEEAQKYVAQCIRSFACSTV